MSKKMYKELKKQAEVLRIQNKMLEEESQRNQLRIIQSSDSNNFHSNSIKKEHKLPKKKYNRNSDETEDSSNYSSLTDLNLDMSQKITDIQKQLSTALLENAKLKKSISYVEAENANLITENHELKWKVESLSKDSDILSEKDSELYSLKDELRKAKSEANQYSQMVKENSIFKQEVASYHQKLAKHQEELKKAKKEIERLTAKNSESDMQIAQMEKTLNRSKEETLKLYRQNQELLANFERRQINQLKIASIPDPSSSPSHSFNDNDSTSSQEYSNKQFAYTDCQKKLVHDFNEIKAFCTSLRDENRSLKNEIRHLREKLNTTKSYQREYYINQKQTNLNYVNDRNPQYENNQAMNIDYNAQNYSNRKMIYNSNQNSNFNYNQSNSNQSNSIRSNSIQSSSNQYNSNQSNSVQSNSNSNNFNIQQISQNRPQIFVLDQASKSIVSRQMSNFLIKMELLNSKVMTKFDHLFLKWNTFETSLRQACSYRKEKIQFRALTNNNSNEQFISSLNRELRIIDGLTRCFAKSHDIPSHAIPNPRQLIGDSEALNNFLDQRGHHHRSRKGRR